MTSRGGFQGSRHGAAGSLRRLEKTSRSPQAIALNNRQLFPSFRFLGEANFRLARKLGARPTGTRNRLKVRAESEQAAIAMLHYRFARVPRHVGESPSEFHVPGCAVGVKRVRIFNEQVSVKQFVRIFIGIGSGRFGATEVNRLLVSRNNGITAANAIIHLDCHAPRHRSRAVQVVVWDRLNGRASSVWMASQRSLR